MTHGDHTSIVDADGIIAVGAVINRRVRTDAAINRVITMTALDGIVSRATADNIITAGAD